MQKGALFFTTQFRLSMTLCKKPFENIVGKGENADSQHFLLFPQCFPPFYPFPKQQNLDSSKLKKFGDDNFKFDENGRKFSKWIENTVGKGEIARYKRFLLFPQCFQKTCTADM